MQHVTADELKAITYLDTSCFQGCIVNLMPYWDGSEWHSWVPTDKGLIKARPVEVAVGDYVAKALFDHLTLSDVRRVHLATSKLGQYLPISHRQSAISHSFIYIMREERFLFSGFRERARIGHGVSQFVSTEIEFVIACARCVIDLLYRAPLECEAAGLG